MTHPLRPRTVTFLLKGDEVLLGMKMRGFGQGFLVGIGGKVDINDRDSSDQEELDVIKNGAAREIAEEIGVDVDPKDLQSMGSMKYYFPDKKGEWDFECHVFIASKWIGEPTGVLDSNGVTEIEPRWIKKHQIPYEKMWDDAKYWLPQILERKSIDGEFVFGEDLKVKSQIILESN